MSYVIKAVLCSAQQPEYGEATVCFPIPDAQYDRTARLLEAAKMGAALVQDCQVNEIDSFYRVLDSLKGTTATMDELDWWTLQSSGTLTILTASVRIGGPTLPEI